MHTTAIDILSEMIKEYTKKESNSNDDWDRWAIYALVEAKVRILALPKSDDELIDFALWYHKDLTDSQRESNIWDLISFFRSLPPTKLPQ